ncbi:hypothetical protein NDU88_000280 [Pleurodeles waltl]|uniref:Uncharacterized protein n=1 Tax=Pleurodeles waltl TaxID=8319 RepID=A0AAV7S7Q6_PLEWA|nr:hypothetical protein NDU88_000280 [Pleurodeles waltl]
MVRTTLAFLFEPEDGVCWLAVTGAAFSGHEGFLVAAVQQWRLQQCLGGRRVAPRLTASKKDALVSCLHSVMMMGKSAAKRKHALYSSDEPIPARRSWSRCSAEPPALLLEAEIQALIEAAVARTLKDRP